jgi:D-sedoheptulose 7-phosphate isomerase
MSDMLGPNARIIASGPGSITVTQPFHGLIEVLRRFRDGDDFDLQRTVLLVKQAKADGNKVIFIGNGGSAAIASHMAADYQKAGRIAAMCLTEASAITALSNDLAFDKVFTEQIHFHGNPGDILFAISCSGESSNIVHAAILAKAKHMTVITFSGCKETNPLRAIGEVNFHVPCGNFRVVENVHLAICHQILEMMLNV